MSGGELRAGLSMMEPANSNCMQPCIVVESIFVPTDGEWPAPSPPSLEPDPLNLHDEPC
jgi:hypothetical protein